MRKILELAGMAFMTGVYAVVFVFEFPARMAMDFYYGWRRGSGLRLEPRPVWTETKFRLTHWVLVTIIIYVIGVVFARLMPDDRVWLTNPWLVAGAGLFASFQWLGVMGFNKPATFITETGERYLLKTRRLTLDASLHEVIRQTPGLPDLRVTFSSLCETPSVQNTQFVSAGGDFVDLRSLFSKEAFHYPDDSNEMDKFSPDYCWGILRIMFLEDKVSVKMLKWLSRVEEIEK